jgi:hypothetical protein
MTDQSPVRAGPGRRARIEIVVPVYNEAAGLAGSITRLCDYLRSEFPLPAAVTIADNASTDGTWRVACEMERTIDRVRAVHLDKKGRGRAIRQVWEESDADVVAYMDVDLATDLRALLPLVAPLVTGQHQVAIGSRLAPGSRVARGAERELVSRAYNLLLRMAVHSRFSDAQCGFKAIRRDAADRLLPLVADGAWFFDTELLILAEANGMRIHEVPVDWTDDPDSRVDVVSTAAADLRGLARMWWRLATGGARIDGRRPSLAAASPALWALPLVALAVLFTVSAPAGLAVLAASGAIGGMLAARTAVTVGRRAAALRTHLRVVPFPVRAPARRRRVAWHPGRAGGGADAVPPGPVAHAS